MFKIIIPFIILLTSCSSRQWNELFKSEPDSSERNEQLLESFEVDTNILDQFKEEVPAVETIAPGIQSDKVAGQSVKKNITTKTKEKKVSRQKRGDKKYKTKNKIERPYPTQYIELNKETVQIWKDFKPVIIHKEKIFIDMNYMGISTGGIIVSTLAEKKIGKEDVYHFNARVKTSSFYSYLYELDDNVDSFVDKKTFRPLKFSLIQRESGQDIDDLQLFNHTKRETYYFYKRVSKEKIKKKNGSRYTPTNFVDPLSVLYFMRGLPLAVGYRATLPIINKGKLLLMTIAVEEKEILNTEIGERETFKVLAQTKYSGDTLKSGKMTFWFSADEDKIFIKFKAKISIGSISGDIAKYERD